MVSLGHCIPSLYTGGLFFASVSGPRSFSSPKLSPYCIRPRPTPTSRDFCRCTTCLYPLPVDTPMAHLSLRTKAPLVFVMATDEARFCCMC